MSVPGVWEEHGHPAVDGWGWYRAHFRLPAEARGKRLLLLGDTLDDRARVYVNGKLVQETTSWDAVWRVDISAAVRAEGDNVIALRIEDTCLLGGVRGSVALVCPDLPSAGETVLPAVLRLAGAARTLSGGPTGVSRRVLTDGKGEQYLVVSNLSGAAATFELTVYGVGKAGKHYLDLLSGTELKARLAGSDLVLAVEVEAEGVRVIRL
jgi:beta-galactosidase